MTHDYIFIPHSENSCRGARDPSERALLLTASESGEQSVDRGDRLVARCSGILCVGDVEGCLVGGREEEVGHDFERLFGERAVSDGELQHCLDSAEAVARFDGAPLLPAKYGGAVDEENSLDLRGQGCVEEPEEPVAEHVERWGLDDLSAGGGDEILLHCFEHSDEQGALVSEVVVKRTTGAGGGDSDDLLRAGVVVAALDKELAGGGDERVTGGFGALGDGSRGRFVDRLAVSLTECHSSSMVHIQPVGPSGPTEEVAVADPIDVVQAFCAAMRKRDAEALREFLADGVAYQNAGMPAKEGVEDVLADLAGQFAMFPDTYEYRMVNVASDGEVVLTERVDMINGFDGSVHGVPVMGTFVVRDAKITRWTDYFDTGLIGKMLSGEDYSGLVPAG